MSSKFSSRNRYYIGERYQAEVVSIRSYGVVVKIRQVAPVLVHLSEWRSGFIADITKEVMIGEVVMIEVVVVDEYSQEAIFSRRSLEENPVPIVVKRTKKHTTKPGTTIGFSSLKVTLKPWIDAAMHHFVE